MLGCLQHRVKNERNKKENVTCILRRGGRQREQRPRLLGQIPILYQAPPGS